MSTNVVGIGSYFTGARVRSNWGDPLKALIENSGDWRPPKRQNPQRKIAKKVAAIQPVTDFAIKLAEASKKLGLS